MKRQLIAACLAACVMLLMTAGGAAAGEVHVTAGCMDGGPGPQFMDMTGTYDSLGAWKKYAKEREAEAMPDTGQVDGICNPDSITVFSITKIKK